MHTSTHIYFPCLYIIISMCAHTYAGTEAQPRIYTYAHRRRQTCARTLGCSQTHTQAHWQRGGAVGSPHHGDSFGQVGAERVL